jgi:triacylglycerol esterase/lipase EstA (alpha/beta hydrolase family)
MSNSAIFITRNQQGLCTVDFRSKPTTVELQASLQELMTHDVFEVKVILPASLSAEFMLIQALAFLRKHGKTVYLTWSDHPPAGTAQQIIQSIIQ